ncbi:MAG TPA: HAD hydrolase family protein [Candidatus Akkermansia intestinigallinarum]|uniref:HAD hydrolase family protein n=1 Tax=Candidatus Akkermansia intestinigallinarum TaxID=2838431 RepID=A0A9D1VBW7_9BACT|nr:HAD hydrolase family protein [Candidatus Akkermansia intestinigallinarum]
MNPTADPAAASCREGQAPPGQAAPFQGPCRWLISLDYDGTLRAENGSPVPAEFLQLMSRWRPLGVRWGINTGRALPLLVRELRQCCRYMPDFICTCERYSYWQKGDGILLPATELNEQTTRANLALRQRMAPQLHRELDRLMKRHPDIEWLIDPADPLSILTPDSDTMEKLVPLLRPIQREFPGVSTQRAGRFMRFSDARFNKGTALANVADAWQVAPQRLVIIGDGHNDLDAFSLFPEAFCAAPGGAHPEIVAYLREHGGYLSRGPGVMEALGHWARLRLNQAL